MDSIIYNGLSCRDRYRLTIELQFHRRTSVGIPAVLATGNGTRRIEDGQMIAVDGGAGMVSLD